MEAAGLPEKWKLVYRPSLWWRPFEFFGEYVTWGASLIVCVGSTAWCIIGLLAAFAWIVSSPGFVSIVVSVLGIPLGALLLGFFWYAQWKFTLDLFAPSGTHTGIVERAFEDTDSHPETNGSIDIFVVVSEGKNWTLPFRCKDVIKAGQRIRLKYRRGNRDVRRVWITE